MPRLTLVMSLLTLAACVPMRDAALPAATPMEPRTDAETLLSEALYYALESPGYVPDRALLQDDVYVPITNEVWRAGGLAPDTLTAHALPTGGRTRFALVSSDEARRLAWARGRFSFVTTTEPDIQGDTAYVSVGVRSIHAVESERSIRGDGFSYGGAGYRIQFVRREGQWVAVEPVSYIAS